MRKNRAFLQQSLGEWYDDFVYISKEPLKNLGFDVYPFDGEDIENTLTCYSLDISKDVIIGSVDCTEIFFKECGISVPKYLGYPKTLNKYYNREIFTTKVSDLYKYDFPYFIKPKNEVKKFTGSLIESQKSLEFLKKFESIDETLELYLTSKLEIISEYRCFVLEDKLEGIHYYQGNFKVFPDTSIIESMIEDYTDCNVSYTLDVGITVEGKTILIEVNDMWAIGSYGMNSRKYSLMCVRRMREMYRQSIGNYNQIWKR